MTTAAHTPGPWGHDPADNWIYAWRENGTQMLVAQGSSRSVSLEVRDANARLIAAAPDLLAEIEREYAEIADIHNNWPGRSTMNGQAKLCRLRDLIAAATGRSGQDVQDDYGVRNAIARAAIAKATGSAA